MLSIIQRLTTILVWTGVLSVSAWPHRIVMLTPLLSKDVYIRNASFEYKTAFNISVDILNQEKILVVPDPSVVLDEGSMADNPTLFRSLLQAAKPLAILGPMQENSLPAVLSVACNLSIPVFSYGFLPFHWENRNNSCLFSMSSSRLEPRLRAISTMLSHFQFPWVSVLYTKDYISHSALLMFQNLLMANGVMLKDLLPADSPELIQSALHQMSSSVVRVVVLLAQGQKLADILEAACFAKMLTSDWVVIGDIGLSTLNLKQICSTDLEQNCYQGLLSVSPKMLIEASKSTVTEEVFMKWLESDYAVFPGVIWNNDKLLQLRSLDAQILESLQFIANVAESLQQSPGFDMMPAEIFRSKFLQRIRTMQYSRSIQGFSTGLPLEYQFNGNHFESPSWLSILNSINVENESSIVYQEIAVVSPDGINISFLKPPSWPGNTNMKPTGLALPTQLPELKVGILLSDIEPADGRGISADLLDIANHHNALLNRSVQLTLMIEGDASPLFDSCERAVVTLLQQRVSAMIGPSHLGCSTKASSLLGHSDVPFITLANLIPDSRKSRQQLCLFSTLSNTLTLLRSIFEAVSFQNTRKVRFFVSESIFGRNVFQSLQAGGEEFRGRYETVAWLKYAFNLNGSLAALSDSDAANRTSVVVAGSELIRALLMAPGVSPRNWLIVCDSFCSPTVLANVKMFDGIKVLQPCSTHSCYDNEFDYQRSLYRTGLVNLLRSINLKAVDHIQARGMLPTTLSSMDVCETLGEFWLLDSSRVPSEVRFELMEVKSKVLVNLKQVLLRQSLPRKNSTEETVSPEDPVVVSIAVVQSSCPSDDRISEAVMVWDQLAAALQQDSDPVTIKIYNRPNGPALTDHVVLVPQCHTGSSANSSADARSIQVYVPFLATGTLDLQGRRLLVTSPTVAIGRLLQSAAEVGKWKSALILYQESNSSSLQEIERRLLSIGMRTVSLNHVKDLHSPDLKNYDAIVILHCFAKFREGLKDHNVKPSGLPATVVVIDMDFTALPLMNWPGLQSSLIGVDLLRRFNLVSPTQLDHLGAAIKSWPSMHLAVPQDSELLPVVDLMGALTQTGHELRSRGVAVLSDEVLRAAIAKELSSVSVAATRDSTDATYRNTALLGSQMTLFRLLDQLWRPVLSYSTDADLSFLRATVGDLFTRVTTTVAPSTKSVPGGLVDINSKTNQEKRSGSLSSYNLIMILLVVVVLIVLLASFAIGFWIYHSRKASGNNYAPPHDEGLFTLLYRHTSSSATGDGDKMRTWSHKPAAPDETVDVRMLLGQEHPPISAFCMKT